MNVRKIVVELGNDDLDTAQLEHLKPVQRALLRAGQQGPDGRCGLCRQRHSARLGCWRCQRVRRWVARYAKLGLAGMHKDAPRGGRPHKVDAQRVVHLARTWAQTPFEPHLQSLQRHSL